MPQTIALIALAVVGDMAAEYALRMLAMAETRFTGHCPRHCDRTLTTR